MRKRKLRDVTVPKVESGSSEALLSRTENVKLFKSEAAVEQRLKETDK